MAKWLRSEDLLQAFKEIPSDKKTTTDKDESDANLSVESVDVEDADHDSQSELTFRKMRNLVNMTKQTTIMAISIWAETNKQDGGKHKLLQELRPEERIM